MIDQNENKNPTSQFLKTDGGKTKSNAIEVPAISLPRGGGAIKGIDEKFSVNAVNGTASFSIPLPFSPARGASPSLSLSYNSGAGNGIFGLGWNLSLASIKRNTDKGIPQYLDATESDIFLFSEAEDLVPEFKKENDGSFTIDLNGDYITNEKDSPDGFFKIRFYKPRIEGLLARIERWTEKVNDRIKWRVITKENTTTLFGWTDNSIISNPDDPTKIYEWLPEFVFDDKGNCSQYFYKKEDKIGFDESLLHNRNRIKQGKITYANLYIDKVLYGNKTPYKKFGDIFPEESDYLFSTVFDYYVPKPNNDLHSNDSPEIVNNWTFRPDAFSDYKAGFEIRTARLCKRVLLFHHFTGIDEYVGLVKSINFEYDISTEQDFTFLKTITSYGYIKKPDGSYSHKKLPALEFEYQKHDWGSEVKTISPEDKVHAPAGLDEQQYQFTDLFNEGLSGILTEQANGWYYKQNLGGGKFERAKLVSPKPSFARLGGVLQLADLDADGGKQLVSYGTEPRGFFELDDDNEWHGLRSFKALPNIDFGDANTRMLDLNGDGKPEVVISEDNVFTWYPSEGRKGYAPANKTIKPFDEEEGPHVVFADTKQTIYLADMSGDGMTDILRIRNGEVCYWPNLGYGNFGAKVAMDKSPVFDSPDAFNPSFLRLADIDGSGTSDIIYLGKNKFTCWKNLSGNRFSTTPFEINPFPEIHSQSKITVTDLLGNGVACIVWSSPLPKDANEPLKYIDLMNSKKPHIMVKYVNNMGKEVSLEYTPSTKFYLADKQEGKPWITKLHFPVHCISKIITEDKISGWHFVNSYKYHHGYYDHPEREFRGFGMVEQIDSESFKNRTNTVATNLSDGELYQPLVITKTWVHTGAFLRNKKILGQFEKEYWFEDMKRQGFLVNADEYQLPDAIIIDENGKNIDVGKMDAQDWREALRACKSMPLRSEVFSKDDDKLIESTPYSVATHNCIIQRLQPRGANKHSIFIVKESEAITYSYERKTGDPRIVHNLNIKFDDMGNALESASVVYPRKSENIPVTIPDATKEVQETTYITYAENSFTKDVIEDNAYRLRLPSEVKTWQLTNVPKTGTYYAIKDFKDILSDSQSAKLEYHQIERPASADPTKRRLIEHVRKTYRNDNLIDPLPIGEMHSHGIEYESYQLAYTKELLNNIYNSKKSDPELVDLMVEGKFFPTDFDTKWWVPSGKVNFIDTGNPNANNLLKAQVRFYLPISYTDPFGSVTKVTYNTAYHLFITETEDPLGNKSGLDFYNFRTLSPRRMRDINNNLSEVISDELGLVKAMAVMGKGTQADDLTGIEEITENEQADIDTFFNTANADGVCKSDILQNTARKLLKNASARFVYDFDVYFKTGKPAVVSSIVRETHNKKEDGSLNPESKLQLSFEYSNGLGKVIMKKVQAEPGKAKLVTAGANNSITITEPDTTPFLRWTGNGRTIHNNKGNPVKQYEPYFSVSPKFEDEAELVQTGVTPVMYYDAIGRLIKTEMPDNTFSKVEFDSWQQKVYDQNDTVKDSDWYKKRTDFTRTDYINDPKELTAADKAAEHYNTPTQLHFDTLGRPVLQIENNSTNPERDNKLYKTKIDLDIESNLRTVTDAREIPENQNKGNPVIQYKYDMLGNLVYQDSRDAGLRWLLTNILSNPLRTWDERDHEFQYFYDIAQRPTHSKVIGGDRKKTDGSDDPLDNIFDRVIYGEILLTGSRTDANRFNEAALQTINVLGQVIQHYDTGGLVDTPDYDFKGQPLATTRNLFKKYKEVANWIDGNLVNDLEPGPGFTFTTKTDALGRITQQTAQDGSIITPSYNEAGLLDGEKVFHPGESNPSIYIKDIDYNEKGQRNKIIYGNDVSTKFYYDKETFRLKQLESKRLNGEVLQNLFYTFDAVGNITHIEDKAIPISFFANSIIEPISEYTYDALYRLAEATGRENNEALIFGDCDNWNDKPFIHAMDPGNPMAVRDYKQHYKYDAVGNIMEMKHLAVGGNWTRGYEYETDNNRLKRTFIGDNGNPANYTKYQHHAKHGFMEELPHLEKINWNFKEEIVLTTRQHCTEDGITPVITYYQYDGSGQRIRKITENQAAAGGTPTKKEERIYVAGYELYKKHTDTNAGLERVSLSLMGQSHRFVMVETRNDINDGTEKQLVRYQLHNHLGSATLELDGTPNAKVISYEEYHPFGTTAYQAINKDIKSAAKRYRYTGMERDEETGLEYHSARYYLPWLGRWLSADPIGIGDGINQFRYGKNNPIKLMDSQGLECRYWDEKHEYMYDICIEDGKFPSEKPGFTPPTTPSTTPAVKPTVKPEMKVKNGVYFITVPMDSAAYVVNRTTYETFTAAATKTDTSTSTEIVINTELYGGDYSSTDPLQSPAEGQVVKNNSVFSGSKSSPLTFFFSIDSSGTWQFGQGDPSAKSQIAFGGGIPVIINGLPYGIENKYKPGAPGNLPSSGDPGTGNQKWLAYRSNKGFEGMYRQSHAGFSNEEGGLTVMGIDKETNRLFIIVKPNDVTSSWRITDVRQFLIKEGVENALAWDGSTSSTLVVDSKVLSTPSPKKDSTIPFGVGFRVPGKLN